MNPLPLRSSSARKSTSVQNCKRFLTGLLAVCFACTAQAQIDGLALQSQVPTASVTVNPALDTQNNWHIWLPGLGGLSTAAGHSAFTLSDALDGNFLDIERVLGTLDGTNHLWTETRVPVFQGGFRVRNLYFRLGAAAVSESRLAYPGELLELAWKGNGHPDLIGRRLDFDGFGVNAQGYTDVYLGASANLMEGRLNFGGNLHLLSGIGTIYTQNSRFGLTTDAEDYTLTADGEFDLLVGGAVLLDSNVVEFDAANIGSGVNLGLAVDLGASFSLEDWTLDASVMNLGGIRWEENATQYTLSGAEFSFSGFDLQEFIDNPDSTEAVLNTVVDSLTTVFSVDETPTSFRTPTSARVQVTVRRSLWEGGQVYAGFNSVRRLGEPFNGMHFGASHQFGRVLTLQAGAQWFEGDQVLIGAGFALRAGPVLLFAQSANIPALIRPENHKTWQGSFGLVLAFGRPDVGGTTTGAR